MADLLGLLRRKNLLSDEDLRKARDWLRQRGLPQDDLLPALVGLGLLAPHDLRANLEELATASDAETRSPVEEEDLYLLGQIVRNRLITLDRLTRCLDHKRALEGSNRTVRIHEILIEDGAIGVPELTKLLEPIGRRLLDCHHCGNLEIVAPREGRATCPRCKTTRNLALEQADHGTTRRRRSDARFDAIKLPVDDPEHIGPYQILELLGRGAAGVVYRGFDPDTGHEVAIKFLAEGLGKGSRNRFHREARILAALDHPGIVRVHGLGQEGHAAFLILDYIAGRTLDRWVAEERPDLEQRVALFRQVAEALAYAHARGILHRDIKPSNILVDGSGIARLTDFGLAKRVGLDGIGNVTDTGEILGTPRFMSPEQVRGDEASEASDQYALGVLLYELLAGRPLYQGVSVGELFAQIEKRVPRPPSAVRPDVPDALDQICLKALEKDPQDRFPSVAALVEQTNRYQLGRPVRLSLTTRRNPQPTIGQRHPRVFWILLLLGLVALALGAAYGYKAYLEFRFLQREKELRDQLMEQLERKR